ncbi:hypothetical protein ACFQH3_01065 [Haladaptatus sp. GCM10025707]|uniref:hypothetical protein n=1 Tax=unclassified Haladaptatus TaxID=2622732 RepID=UPI0023E7A729|nr:MULTISPECIES: hypothetical protein [unclassified Haladaptatus]
MNRSAYAVLSVLVATLVPAVVFLVSPPPTTSWFVLLAIAVVYGVGAFAGVTTFGAAALGFGLASFGLAAGVAFEHERIE